MEQAINFFRTHFGLVSSTDSELKAEPDFLERATDTPSNSISFGRRRVVGGLVALATVLFAANLAVMIADYLTGYDMKLVQRLVKVFSVDYELNAPAFFSTLILLFSSVLLAVITYFKQKQRDQYVWHWAVLSFGFLFMAYDEMASAHEKLVEPMRELLAENNSGVFYFAWVVPGIVLVAILGFFFLRFWWKLPPKTRTWLFIAAALYLGGSLGMELVDGSYAATYGEANLTYRLLSTFEEGLEVAGIIVFIYALLGYIAENSKELVFRLGGRAE